MKKHINCAFTGYRPRRFPWGYDETDSRCAALKAELSTQIAELADGGVTGFLSGMALATDTWAAMAVLELREKKSRAETPLHPPLQRAGGQVERFSAGAISLDFGGSGFPCLRQPEIS